MTFRIRLNASATLPLMLSLAASLVICSGCGQNNIKLSSAESKAFEEATPEIKKAWDGALAADRAKDYVKGQELFDSLAQMQLSEIQKQALDKQSTVFALRLLQAAEKNDPVAVKVIQDQQRSNRRSAPEPRK